MANEKVREDNQQRVIEKAIELCAEKGIEQMTMAHLAREAKVSLRSVFRYYECKETLVKNIVQIAIEDLIQSLEAVTNQKSYEELDGRHKVITLCRTMLMYAREHCKLQSKLIAAEPYLNEIGIPDTFSLFDYKNIIVPRLFLTAFKAGVKDGSINQEILDNECNFNILAISYRGFYSRVAMISVDETMSSHYNPEQIIEDYLRLVNQMIRYRDKD